MTSCSFHFESQDWAQKHDVDIEDHWTWSCPYEVASEEGENCIFHMQPHSRRAKGLSKEDLSDAFVKQVLRGDKNRLHGASIGDIEMAFLSLSDHADNPINLMANSFGNISFANAQIRVGLRLAYSNIDTLDLKHAVFERPLDIQRATIEDSFTAPMANLERVYAGGANIQECNLSETNIDRIGMKQAEIGILNCTYAELSILLDEVTIKDDIILEKANFSRFVQCRDATFHCSFDVKNATVQGNVLLEGTDFLDGVSIENCSFEGLGLSEVEVRNEFRISNSTIAELILDQATFHSDVNIQGEFRDRLRMNNPTLEGELHLHNIESDKLFIRGVNTELMHISAETIMELSLFTSVVEHLSLSGGKFGSLMFDDLSTDYMSVRNADIESFTQFNVDGSDTLEYNRWAKVRFAGTKIDSLTWRGEVKPQFVHIEFIGGEIKSAELFQPDEGIFVYSFEQTAIRSIKSENPGGPDLRYIHFLQPEFNDFPFESYSEELAPDWNLNQGPGINRRTFDQTPSEKYQTYQAARADAEESNQEDARSGLYKREMEHRRAFLKNRSTDRSNWLPYSKSMEIKLLDLICGYGEDPGKPVVWASLGITFFALLYSVDILAQGNTLTNSLISGFTLSLQSFATLIFGVDSQTVNTKLRFLTSIEGALSTLLIPFLVFSLTKSID